MVSYSAFDLLKMLKSLLKKLKKEKKVQILFVQVNAIICMVYDMQTQTNVVISK